MSAIKTLGGMGTIMEASFGTTDGIIQILITAFPKLATAITAASTAATAAGGGFAGLKAGIAAFAGMLNPVALGIAAVVATIYFRFYPYTDIRHITITSEEKAFISIIRPKSFPLRKTC